MEHSRILKESGMICRLNQPAGRICRSTRASVTLLAAAGDCIQWVLKVARSCAYVHVLLSIRLFIEKCFAGSTFLQIAMIHRRNHPYLFSKKKDVRFLPLMAWFNCSLTVQNELSMKSDEKKI